MSTRSISRAKVSYAPQGRTWRLFDLLGLYRSRRALNRLDRSALEDLGLNEVEAAREASRPVWDVPDSWRN